MFRSMPPLLVAALFAVPAGADTAPKLYVAHYGRLLNVDDTPADGAHKFTVRLYSDNIAGSTNDEKLWEDTFNNVVVAKGLFSITLGSGLALTSQVFTGRSAVFMSIAVDVGVELMPRVAVGRVPMASQAEHAALADFATATGAVKWTGGEVALNAAGKWPASSLDIPTNLATLTDGRLSASQLPVNVATLTDGKLTATQLPSNVAVLDSNNRLPLTALPSGPSGLDAATVGGNLPSAFAVAGHKHPSADLTDGTSVFAAKSHTHAAVELTDGAATFAAKTHTHTAAEITNGTTIFAAKAHAHPSTEISDFNTAVTAILNPLLNARGTVANTVMVQSRDQATIQCPNSGNGNVIAPLTLVITPRKAGNKMILDWVVNGEGSHNAVYIVTRNGTPLTDSSNGSNTRWAGVVAQPYDVDNDSTPTNARVRIFDFDTLGIATTYEVRIRASDSSQPNFFLNRAVSSAGQDSYETSLSTGIATEIWQ